MRHSGHGRDGMSGRGGRGTRDGLGKSRAQRGDVRTAIMLVLAEQPRHGYQIMQAISEQTDGAWRPSPGAIYPTIAQLADEGLVTTDEQDGRKQVELTEAGRVYLRDRTAQRGDPFADYAERRDTTTAPGGLAPGLSALSAAAAQVVSLGTPVQVDAADAVLTRARRELYLILADVDPEASGPMR